MFSIYGTGAVPSFGRVHARDRTIFRATPMIERRVKELLEESTYLYRGVGLSCVRLLLVCGHVAYRRRYKEKVVCLECIKESKAKEPSVPTDETGQILLMI